MNECMRMIKQIKLEEIIVMNFSFKYINISYHERQQNVIFIPCFITHEMRLCVLEFESTSLQISVDEVLEESDDDFRIPKPQRENFLITINRQLLPCLYSWWFE